MTPAPFQFHMPTDSQDGVAASDDKLYRWAAWRFWDITLSYIVFVSLFPRSARDPILETRIEAWLTKWERHRPQGDWDVGGYVMVSVFSRVAWNVESLRRLINN